MPILIHNYIARWGVKRQSKSECYRIKKAALARPTCIILMTSFHSHEVMATAPLQYRLALCDSGTLLQALDVEHTVG